MKKSEILFFDPHMFHRINKGNLVALDTTQKLLDRIQTKKNKI